MGLIAYDDEQAAAFQGGRVIADKGLVAWREAVGRHLPSASRGEVGGRLLDLGAGTGQWAVAFSAWYEGLEVVAVEPSEAMRARCGFGGVLAGDAADIPLPDQSVDAVWLSTVVHHIPDLSAAAHEIGRILRPQGRVLIRSVFAGRHHEITLFQFWPEAVRVIDSYPSVEQVEAAFAGFVTLALERVAQTTASSLHAVAQTLDRKAHTPLVLITDEEYDSGLARLHEEALTEPGPVVDAMDLLVLQAAAR